LLDYTVRGKGRQHGERIEGGGGSRRCVVSGGSAIFPCLRSFFGFSIPFDVGNNEKGRNPVAAQTDSANALGRRWKGSWSCVNNHAVAVGSESYHLRLLTLD
jgi:hypothetical protein